MCIRPSFSRKCYAAAIRTGVLGGPMMAASTPNVDRRFARVRGKCVISTVASRTLFRKVGCLVRRPSLRGGLIRGLDGRG